MALSDLLYPDNPKRRAELISTHQEIVDCLKGNFRFANKLSDLVNEHCATKLQHIEMRQDQTFKEICDLFMSRLRDIQKILDKIDQELKEKLHPEDYQKLRDAKEYSGDVFLSVRKIAHVAEGVIFSVGGVMLAIRCVPILARLFPTFATFTLRIAASSLAFLGIGVVAIGIDVIISAIVGAVEREKLNKAIAEHKELLELIQPVSEQFCDAVIEIKITLKHHKK